MARDEVAGEAVVSTLDKWVARPDLTDAQVLTVARTYFAAGRRKRGLGVLDALPGEAGTLLIELAREIEFSSSRELAADLYELALRRDLPPDQRADASLRVARLRLAEGDWRAALALLDEPQTVAEYAVEATLLGHDKPLECEAAADGLHIAVPRLSVDEAPARHAYVFRLTGVE